MGFGADAVRLGEEDAVAAVYAPAHDEVGGDSARAVRGQAEDDAAAGIGIAGKLFGDGADVIHVHIVFPFSFTSLRQTSSAALGMSFHSACSMTRLCRISGVSPGRMFTAFCRMISPPSGISLT